MSAWKLFDQKVRYLIEKLIPESGILTTYQKSRVYFGHKTFDIVEYCDFFNGINKNSSFFLKTRSKAPSRYNLWLRDSQNCSWVVFFVPDFEFRGYPTSRASNLGASYLNSESEFWNRNPKWTKRNQRYGETLFGNAPRYFRFVQWPDKWSDVAILIQCYPI